MQTSALYPKGLEWKNYKEYWDKRLLNIGGEMHFALESMKKDDLKKIFIDLLKISFKEVWQNKYDIGKSFYENVKKSVGWIKLKSKKYKKEGISNTMKKDFCEIENKSKETYHNIELLYKNFVTLDIKQKKRVIIESVLYVFTFIFFALLTGGGIDFEGGAPDLDLAAGKIVGKGAGWHRNPLTHSLVMALGIEFLLRFSFRLIHEIYKYFPEEHDVIWDKIEQFVKKYETISIAGVYAGIAIHLIQDSNLLTGGFGERVKAYVWLPSMSDNAHQAILATNAVASGGIAGLSMVQNKKNK